WTGHPRLLGGDPLYPLPGDLLRLGTAPGVHGALGEPLGELPDDGVAGGHRRLSLRRRHHAHDALDPARGAPRGLHPHGLGQGPAGTGGGHPSRSQELHAPGHHPDRDGVRVPHRRSRRHRDRVHAQRGGTVRGGRRRPPRLPGRAGSHLPHRVQLRDREPPRRPDLRLVRPAHPPPLTMATTTYALEHAAASAELAPRTTVGEAIVKFIRTKPIGAAGALIILVLLGAAASAELLAPYDPYRADYALQFSKPSAAHWFGTDEFGRDLMSPIMYWARIALLVGFSSSFVGCTIGGLLGVISACWGGKVDLLRERRMDILLAFPQLILALAIASILGPAVPNVVIGIYIPIIPRAARIVRATALSVKENVCV